MNNQAYIFDLDGTILDTQTPFHATAECQVVLQESGEIINPEDISARFAGIPTEKVFEALVPGSDTQKLLNNKWKIIEELIAATDLQKLNLLGEACTALANKNIPLAVASASPRWYIESVLEKVIFDDKPLLQYFDYYVSAEDVERPKPHPDVFLHAAENINVKPEHCVVVGDGSSDVEGGLAAGMSVLYLSNNTRYDDHAEVQRFSNATNLSDYLLKK